MALVSRRPLAAADILDIWDHVVRVLHSARDIDAVFGEDQ